MGIKPKKPWEVTPQVRGMRKSRHSKQLQHMWEYHHEIKRLTILGYRPKDISEKLGLAKRTIELTLKSELVQEELAVMSALRDEESVDVAIEIRNATPGALDTLKGIERGNLEPGLVPYSLRLAAAKDLMDRGGYAAPKVVHTVGVQAHITQGDLDEIKERAIKMGLMPKHARDDDYIDAEVEEVSSV